jgi:hypothetical protein
MNSQFDENDDHVMRLEIIIPLSGNVVIHAGTCECISMKEFKMYEQRFDGNYTVQTALITLIDRLYHRLIHVCGVPIDQSANTITYNQTANLDILSMGENNVKHPTIQ